MNLEHLPKKFIEEIKKYERVMLEKKLKELKFKEFDFIEKFMDKYNIRRGVGLANWFGLLIAEYKLFNKKNEMEI